MLLQQDFNKVCSGCSSMSWASYLENTCQQVLATLLHLPAIVASQVGYGYLAMISRLLSLANWRSARLESATAKAKTAKALAAATLVWSQHSCLPE